LENDRHAGNIMTPTTRILSGTQFDVSALFMEAIREDSNLEMDWLWLARQVKSRNEREFALRRALHINPRSEAAQRALRNLETHVEPSHIPHHGFVNLFRNGLRVITSNR
jgi:hypothetical protein